MNFLEIYAWMSAQLKAGRFEEARIVVDVKHHTIMYLIDGEHMSEQAILSKYIAGELRQAESLVV
jgi:hypothetical protein